MNETTEQNAPGAPASAHAAAKRTPTPSRRSFLLGAAGTVALVALGGAKYIPTGPVVRPPGAQDDALFYAGCIHCQKCIEMCPKHAITISHLEDGILQMRAPKMDFKAGWCDFCEEVEGGPVCYAVCPTDAIQRIEEPTVDIGIAVLKKEWCLAYRGTGCHSCVDACEYDALELDEAGIPVVDEDACNGCGACEFDCISLMAGSLSGTWDESEMTDRAITVKPLGYEEELA